MALLVRGRTRCVVCNKVIGGEDAVLSVPAFVRDRTSDLFPYSDGVVHVDCLASDPVARRAADLAHETIERLGPGNRSCEVCAQQVRDPDDYVTLGFLTERAGSPAATLNWLQFHRSHLHRWERLPDAIALLEGLVADEGWCVDDIAPLVQELRSHAW